MGKRSDFERIPRDHYPTPPEAVAPLLAHLLPKTQYIEPCAGNGDLVRHLNAAGHLCRAACDIEPGEGIARGDALEWSRPMGIAYGEFMIITNPPWDRSILHPLIVRLSDAHPTWLLFDADWVHTKQAIPYLDRLVSIVSVGRVRWIPDTKMTGKDNCAWHLFMRPTPGRERLTTFHGRQA